MVLWFLQRPYCFELGNLCYTWHSPQTGQMYQVLRMGLVKCVDDHTTNLQNTLDDFNDTNRRADHRYD